MPLHVRVETAHSRSYGSHAGPDPIRGVGNEGHGPPNSEGVRPDRNARKVCRTQGANPRLIGAEELVRTQTGTSGVLECVEEQECPRGAALEFLGETHGEEPELVPPNRSELHRGGAAADAEEAYP